ncbi:uncharacterized protein LOC128839862 isoform X1 [Malaclemys terrapin pileata]|uniref:uncharacterized protein LOC128839862 isoform X1 n=1 Tax=Malaclemys terrapin pileata TaxID=2991368 RepID=UPI0023A7A1EF|nr:uncharacterized protein LOC128839862 isoform X1 [Malaclemys terrapin pileata]XP_053889179.1 uncharacterized protein LOC128839862 isoform X1 [Malaclemys terrapin pileata]
MSRKRRKSCKGRKSSDAREYEHLPAICKCQQNVKGLQNKADEDLVESNFPEPVDVERSEENRKDHSCTPMTGQQNNSGACEDKEQENTDDCEKEGGKEKDCPPPAFSHQQEEVLAVVTFNESEALSTGKITLKHNPSSAEPFDLASEVITAELKCGGFNMNVEIKKGLFDSGTSIVIEKRKCPKNRKCYRDKKYQKSHYSKCRKCQDPSTDHSIDDNESYKASSKHKIQIASNKNTSLKVSIIGKEIKVKYNNRKQYPIIHIEPGEHTQSRGKTCSRKYGNTYSNDTDYSVTEVSCSTDYESDFSLHEKEESFTNYTCPDWYLLLPPPEEFADSKEICLDTTTEVATLLPISDRKEPDTLPAVLSAWEEGNHICKQKEPGTEDLASEKEDYCKDKIIFSEFSYNGGCHLDTNGSSEKSFGKEPIDETNEAGQIRNNSLIDIRNTMIASHLEPKAVRRKSFPDATIDVLSPVHLRRDSGFYSLPSLSLKVLPKQAKAVDVYSKNTQTPTSCTELCKCSSLTSFSSLRALKSYQYAFTSYNHDMTIYHSELEGSIDDAFFLTHYEDYIGDCKEMEETLVETFHSTINSSVEQKLEHRYSEPLQNLAVCDEHTEFTESGFDEETLESDHHFAVQGHVEVQNKALIFQVPSPSRSSSNDHFSDKSIANTVAIDCVQSQHSTLQPRKYVHPATTEPEVTIKKRKGSVMTVITGERERRLIIQGDSKGRADSFGSGIKNEPKLPCSIREKSFMSPLLDAEESDIDNELQSFSEIRDISGNIPDEANFHDDSTHITSMSSSSMHPEDKQVFTEGTFTKETKENLCSEQEITSQLSDHLRIEPVACQIEQLVKSSSEETEKKCETKDCCQNTDTPMSPRKQISQKDLKSEVNKTIKLPGEPVLKDTRASDGSQEEAIDRWARQRKQFKDSKKCSSTGGSSITSTITEISINSEEARSVDLSLRSENEERGFYTENFHSASWVFRGDDSSPDNSPRCLSKRPRPVAVRERTVRIAKGTGDYPWGFRIQFSKPILVTEVDTNSAAEEAGLQVGDIVLAVNGTDVTSMPHSQAANLARKGPDILTLLVGSDISRCPNTPRPTCRGYLHKRTHSGILKGWRKRWFVLKHDGCLHYYKHKKDEGKCKPLDVTKLEGAEIGVDSSLGKPFVFKCMPQTGNKIFYFCATSNQEMKRWLEAMDKAVHPVHQNHVWVDVTLHNTSLPPLAIKNPECLGLLHQLDKTRDVWTQHYCILKDGCLYFYAGIRSTHAIGGIYLQGYTVSEQSLGSRRSVIEMKPPSEEFQTFYLCAENVNENKRWITALKTSINKWVTLHQAIQDFMNRPLEETKM